MTPSKTLIAMKAQDTGRVETARVETEQDAERRVPVSEAAGDAAIGSELTEVEPRLSVQDAPGAVELDWVADVRSALMAELGSARFDLYFESITFHLQPGAPDQGACFVVRSENDFSLSQIRNRFNGLLKTVISQLAGEGVELRFEVAEPRMQTTLFPETILDEMVATGEPAGNSKSRSKRPRQTIRGTQGASATGGQVWGQLEMFGEQAGGERAETGKTGRKSGKLGRPVGAVIGTGRPTESAAEDGAAIPQRAPASRAAMSLSNFQFGAANSLARAAIDQVIQRPGQISPLVLHGPVGCGKTHLAAGLSQHMRRRFSSFTVLHLSAEQFTSRFLQALNGSGLPSLRAQFRDVDLLVLEDVQFFQGKKATLVELQHTIDNLLRLGKQLVLTSDRHPNDLNFLSPEIQTRLVSGLVIQMQSADREARLAICRQWAEDWRLTLAEGMAEWLADHVAGDVRCLSGALFRLMAVQSSRAELVHPREGMEILSDYAAHHSQLCSLSMIQKAVCGLCGVEPSDLAGSKRTRKISGARMLAMFLARKHTPAALSEIGEFFGGRRHSTVVAAEKRVRSWVQTDEPIETAVRPLNLREAIRRVESALKTG